MKRYFLLLSLLTGIGYAAEVYTIDPTHSYVEYHINHFGYSNSSGKWYASGVLNLDQQRMQNSSVKVDIQVANIVTGIPKLDEHLKGISFFEVTKYPNATFLSQKVSMIKNNQFKLEGLLTLHGVSKPVTLMVYENQIAINPITKLKTAGFSATTTIKRSDFGISSYLPSISDKVKLNIEVEAQLKSSIN